jgi:NRAMP (natural resistance-associated macrophage protein)-like metal ion transporter
VAESDRDDDGGPPSPRGHRPGRRPARRRLGRQIALLAAVVGPGLLAGLSDDDPAGITTYSVLGANYGYRLLWVLLLSTVALLLFQNLGARVGVVTGQGLAGLVRQRYGARLAFGGVTALLVANVGTMCAEFAGLAAGMQLFGVTRYVSVPAAAIVISLLVLRRDFRGVEHVLLVLSAVFVTYIVSGWLAHPNWGAAIRGTLTPSMPITRGALVIATATIGTTLAPWGQAFIQSYAADKHLTPDDLRYERVDVFVGATLTGVIGFFVVVACAATLNRTGGHINQAADAAAALHPLAGDAAAKLFGLGLVGAALLAASVLPLSTAYSVSEFLGVEGTLNDRPSEAPQFYATFAVVTGIGALVVLVPGAPLVPILVLTQVVNAVLLLPLLAFMYGICRDRRLMGTYAAGPLESGAYVVVIGFIAVSVSLLGILSVV